MGRGEFGPTDPPARREDGSSGSPPTGGTVTGTTCLYAVYDPVERCCTPASAGHYPPAVVHPDGRRVPAPAWLGELDGMRHRITANRADLVAHLRALGHEEQATSLVRQKGMFSMLPLMPDQMRRLRGQFGIYGTNSGRINIAGVSGHRIPYLAQGIAAVLETPPGVPGGTAGRPRRDGCRTGWWRRCRPRTRWAGADPW
ncbi:aminotransferase class I/II-fold pyridoxal phosphate-dependent enzyme [Streptomyces sp. NPDC005181]|uniref:aminotransferase class I/II-fold pyridoxal phosphate-dependent enzyme n=1 Tax=Streptomyces sp. NPDC005181 TaxID=3156869 RepID=UPI0033AD46D6